MARKEVIQIRCSAQEKEKWMDVAATHRMDLSTWIRSTLDKATRPGAPQPFAQQPLLDATSPGDVENVEVGKVGRPQHQEF